MMILIPVALAGGKAVVMEVAEESLNPVSEPIPTALALEIADAVTDRRRNRTALVPPESIREVFLSNGTRTEVAK